MIKRMIELFETLPEADVNESVGALIALVLFFFLLVFGPAIMSVLGQLGKI